MDKLRDFPLADTVFTKRHYDSLINDLYNEGRKNLYQMLTEDIKKDEKRELLQQLSDDYHRNTRYFLVDWLAHSRWRKPCVRKITDSDYYIYVSEEKAKRYFKDVVPEDLELKDKENEFEKEEKHKEYIKYIEVLTDIACFHEGEQIRSSIKKILKTAFQSRSKIYVLKREEGIYLAHALRMTFSDASKFIYKNCQDGEWDFKRSGDQIDRYAFLHDLGLKKIAELQNWYNENCKQTEGSLLKNVSDNMRNVTSELTENDNEILGMTEEDFKDYLLRHAKYFGEYSRTAIGLMRNLAGYYVKYSKGALVVDTGFYEEKMKSISECSNNEKEHNFDKWIKTFCLDSDNNVRNDEGRNWESLLKDMLLALKKNSSIYKQNTYEYLRSFTFDKEHVRLQFPREHYRKIFLGQEAVKKQDMLFMLFLCCNLSWGEDDEEQNYMVSRFNGFTKLADLFLDVAFLPRLYLPAAFEETLIRAILDAKDYTPLMAYEQYCEVYSSREKDQQIIKEY